MKKLLQLLFILLSSICNGQNLIPNGDFEQFWNCPTNPYGVDFAKYWIQPTGGSSNYFNQCGIGWANVPNNYFGLQAARSGVGYGGLYTFIYSWLYREYIEVPIKENALIQNDCYHYEMYINLANDSKYNYAKIGVYFSDSIINSMTTYTNLTCIPQINNGVGNYPDTLNWTLVSGDFVSTGNEKYVVIGNFNSDTTVSPNTILVNPSSPSQATYIFIDDVSLTPCASVGIRKNNIEYAVHVYPNPVIDKLFVNINNDLWNEISIYDIYSVEKIKKQIINNSIISTMDLTRGIYLYKVICIDGTVKEGKFIKE